VELYAFVDWDDTLAQNIGYFRLAARAAASYISCTTGVPYQTVRRLGDETDLEVARKMGLTKDSFPSAWVETYKACCTKGGVSALFDSEAVVSNICRQPYLIKQRIMANASRVLTWLRIAGFEVCIWTVGDLEIQNRKVSESGLSDLVDRVIVPPVKNPATLQAAMEERPASRCVMIGNSLHSDIMPALKLRIGCVHVEKQTWAYDQSVGELPADLYRKVKRLAQVPGAVKGLFNA